MARLIQRTSSSLNPSSTQTPIVVVVGQHRLQGPIPLVATNPNQHLPAHINREREQYRHSHYLYHHSHNPNEMDSNSQIHQSTLPRQVEEEIRAAVLASLPKLDQHGPIRRTVAYRKLLRWLSISLSIAALIGVIVPTAVIPYTVEIDAISVFAWGPVLAVWNGWRLFRLKQKFNHETISAWHVAFDALFLSVHIILTVFIILWTVNRGQLYSWQYAFDRDVFWRAAAVSVVFAIWFVLHSILFIITVVEKWTKPTPLYWDSASQPLPPIIVQYSPAYTASHEPQYGEDDGSGRAEVGDSQPQGIAPAYAGSNKKAASEMSEFH